MYTLVDVGRGQERRQHKTLAYSAGEEGEDATMGFRVLRSHNQSCIGLPLAAFVSRHGTLASEIRKPKTSPSSSTIVRYREPAQEG